MACELSQPHRSVWKDKSETSYQPQARQTQTLILRHSLTDTDTHADTRIICYLISAIQQGLSLEGDGAGEQRGKGVDAWRMRGGS